MDITGFKKRAAPKKEIVSVRVTTADKVWLKQNKISPTKVFDDFLTKARENNK